MLESKSLYYVHNFKIGIEELIAPVFHLVLEISDFIHKEQSFAEWGEKLFDVVRIYEQDSIPDDEDEQSILARIAKVLSDELFNNAHLLAKTNIVVIYKHNRIISKCQANELKTILTTWLYNFSPIKHFFSFLKDERIKRLENQMVNLLNRANYSKVIEISDSTIWDSCIIPTSWLTTTELQRAIVDPASVWINTSFVDAKDQDVHERYYSGAFVGLDINTVTIPFVNMDKWIHADFFSSYFMQMLKEVYSADKKIGEVARKEIEPFLDVAKNDDFCKLLSYLHFNLYIVASEKSIPDQYKSLFDEVIGIEQISNVDNFQLYVSKPSVDQIRNNATLVGIYEKRKTGTEYNLLNWIHSSEGSNALSLTGSKQSKQNIKSVFALRPQFYYYFVSKFFEDNFASLLKDLNCDCRTNLSLVKKGDTETFIEIDTIIRKKDGSFLYVENKTTLNKQNIEETIKKIEKFHSYILNAYPLLHFQYLIVAPYCNTTIDDGFRFFIKDDQSEIRNDVKTKIYDFNIPIAKFPDVCLRCVVEPEYDKLLNKMKEIIQ